MLRFDDKIKNSILIYDDEIQECIGNIRYSPRDKAYCFDPFGGIFLLEHMRQITTEMERLTAEREKSTFLTFDE